VKQWRGEKMKSHKFFVVYLFLAIGLISGVAYKSAYGLSECPKDDGVALEDYPTIFIGKVMDIKLKGTTFEEFNKRTSEIELDTVSSTAIMKTEVKQLLKGKIDKIVKVQAEYGYSCDAILFRKGQEYIFFGYSNGSDEVSVIGRCEGTQEVSQFGALFELEKKLQLKK
jgi:hypothetical protein